MYIKGLVVMSGAPYFLEHLVVSYVERRAS